MSLTPIHIARDASIRRTVLPDLALKASAAMAVRITASKAIVVMATGSILDSGTHVELNCGLVTPTKTIPTTKRASKSTWVASPAADLRPSFAITQMRNCSIDTLAS